jgi:hypothetical protein
LPLDCFKTRMTKLYNQNELLRYYYGELDEASSKLIANQLLNDQVFWQMYIELVKEITCLNAISENPSDTSIEIIMEYAKEKNPNLLTQ